MEAHIPPTQDVGANEPLVRHVTQAQPNDLVDPWWMDQALARDYGEFLSRQWVVDVEDIEPEVIDRSLTDALRLLRRGTLLNTRRIQCVVEGEDAVACVQLGRRLVWAGEAARDLMGAQRLLAELERSFPESSPTSQDRGADERPHVVLGIWGLAEDSRGFRKLEVNPWSDIADNYGEVLRARRAHLRLA